MRLLIVTGATGGLGSAVVRELGGDYECVALHRGTAPAGMRGVQADLGDARAVREAVRSIAAELGAPYGLVHLAGGYAPGALAETTDETWSHMLSLNLTAAFVAIRETVAVMDPAAGGRIIVISSDATRTRLPGSLAYTVSKTALNALIEQVAEELRPTAITANALLPSALDTPAMREVMPRERLVPLERVAATVRFLLSDAAASITGALVPLGPR